MSRIKQTHPKKSVPVAPSLRKKTSKVRVLFFSNTCISLLVFEKKTISVVFFCSCFSLFMFLLVQEIKQEVLRHYRCMADLGIAFGKERSYYRLQLWSSCLQGVYAFEKVLGYVSYLLAKRQLEVEMLGHGVWRVHANQGSAVIVVNPKYLQYGKDKRTGTTEPAHGVAVYYWPCETARRSLVLWDIWTAIVNHFRVFQQGKIAEGTVDDVCAFYEEKRSNVSKETKERKNDEIH